MKKLPYIAIIILTILDIVFTVWGLKVRYIEEANVIFAPIFEYSYVLAIFLVASITGAGLYVIHKLQRKSKIAKYGLGIILTAKTYIFYLHLNWFMPVVPLLIHRYNYYR